MSNYGCSLFFVFIFLFFKNAVVTSQELSSTERESDKHFLSGKSLKPGEESRAYNVCSASVSSCMQIKRVPSLVATKTDEFTDEVSKGKAVRSINDADLSSTLMSNACISINCPSGETNNPLTGDLIHDSLSGNKKMEDTSNASPSSEAFETLAKVNTASVVKSVVSIIFLIFYYYYL